MLQSPDYYDNSESYMGTIDTTEDVSRLKIVWKKFRRRRSSTLYFVAFKYVMTEGMSSPNSYANPLSYLKGSTVEMTRQACDRNSKHSCGAGINVASNWWVIKEAGADLGHLHPSYTIIKLRIYIKDIVCIPEITDGKFRVCKVEVL